jgi:hypothetical protein
VAATAASSEQLAPPAVANARWCGAPRNRGEGKLTMAIQAGDVAPEFSLQTHQGNVVALQDLRGHKVLIWFYPEADTPG